MADVFISYSSKDYDLVVFLLNYLEENGIDCWMAPRNIPGGSYYAKEIPNAIYHSSVFLIVLSKNSQKSEYVLRELDYAASLNRTILPFVIDDEPLVPEFDFLLRTKQRFQLSDGESVYTSLLERIQTICKKEAAQELRTMGDIIGIAEVQDESPQCPLCGSMFLWLKWDWLDRLARNIESRKIFFILYPFAATALLVLVRLSIVLEKTKTFSLQVFAGDVPIYFAFFFLTFLVSLASWLHEQRRRRRIRKHIMVDRYECKECKHRFNVITDTKTGKIVHKK